MYDNITSNLQDLLVFATKSLSYVLRLARKEGINIPKEVNHIISENLFITITNANFDDEAICDAIDYTLSIKRDYINKLDEISLPEYVKRDYKREEYNEVAKHTSFMEIENEDVRSLRALITFGLKGLAAY